MTTVEQRYAEAEAEAAAKRQARAGRQRLVLLGVVNALVLGVGLTAMIDLRRLRTPEGTALAWTQAALFGECDHYLEYSVADRTRVDERTPDEVCRDLRKATEPARADSLRIGLRLGRVLPQPYGVDVEILLTRDKADTQVVLQVVQRDGRWRVVRNARACTAVGCA